MAVHATTDIKFRQYFHIEFIHVYTYDDTIPDCQISLFRRFWTKPPKLKTANISAYTVDDYSMHVISRVKLVVAPLSICIILTQYEVRAIGDILFTYMVYKNILVHTHLSSDPHATIRTSQFIVFWPIVCTSHFVRSSQC